MNSLEVSKFLKDFRMRGSFEFITSAEENDEAKEIAKSRGIDIDNCDKDFAFFKNIYALVDTPNANKCIIPKDKIEPMLSSIILKPIDIDHIRNYTVGVYLDAKLEKDIIYAYGIIFKANFENEWEEMKQLFEDGKLTSSFEIWCPKDKRTYNDDGTFTLDAPVIAGGAILFKTTPAFKEAKVLELAKKSIENRHFENKINFDLVAANVSDEELLTSEYNIWSIDQIQTLINTVPCPECGADWAWNVTVLDFKNQVAKCECYNCSLGVEFTLKPQMDLLTSSDLRTVVNSSLLTTEERNKLSDSDFALVIKKDKKKVRMFPVHDADHVRNALSRIAQEKVQKGLEKMEVEVETVKNNIIKKAKKLGLTDIVDQYKSTKEEVVMEEKIKELEAEVAKLKVEIEAAKVESAKKDEQIKTLEEAKKQISEAAQAELKKATDEVTAKVEEAKKQAVILTERKAELGEFAKDMKEEDILNDDKYEIAKLKKENASISKALEEAKKSTGKEAGAVRGSEQTTTTPASDNPALSSYNKVRAIMKNSKVAKL